MEIVILSTMLIFLCICSIVSYILYKTIISIVFSMKEILNSMVSMQSNINSLNTNLIDKLLVASLSGDPDRVSHLILEKDNINASSNSDISNKDILPNSATIPSPHVVETTKPMLDIMHELD